MKADSSVSVVSAARWACHPPDIAAKTWRAVPGMRKDPRLPGHVVRNLRQHNIIRSSRVKSLRNLRVLLDSRCFYCGAC